MSLKSLETLHLPMKSRIVRVHVTDHRLSWLELRICFNLVRNRFTVSLSHDILI